MSKKFEDMEITKLMRDQNEEKDRFDEAKHQHEREEQSNLKTILKQQMDMENLKKELVKREHREILAKNFGPEENNERTRL